MKYLLGYSAGDSAPLKEMEVEAEGYNWHANTVIFYITEPHGLGTRSKTVFEISTTRAVYVAASRSDIR